MTVKLAAGSDVIRKYPESDVSTVRSIPVLELLIVTAALGTTDPFGSVTVPSIALVNWANAEEQMKVSANSTLADLESNFPGYVLISLSLHVCTNADFNQTHHSFWREMGIEPE